VQDRAEERSAIAIRVNNTANVAVKALAIQLALQLVSVKFTIIIIIIIIIIIMVVLEWPFSGLVNCEFFCAQFSCLR